MDWKLNVVPGLAFCKTMNERIDDAKGRVLSKKPVFDLPGTHFKDRAFHIQPKRQPKQITQLRKSDRLSSGNLLGNITTESRLLDRRRNRAARVWATGLSDVEHVVLLRPDAHLESAAGLRTKHFETPGVVPRNLERFLVADTLFHNKQFRFLLRLEGRRRLHEAEFGEFHPRGQTKRS